MFVKFSSILGYDSALVYVYWFAMKLSPAAVKMKALMTDAKESSPAPEAVVNSWRLCSCCATVVKG